MKYKEAEVLDILKSLTPNGKEIPQNINIQEVDNKLLPIVRNIKIKEILK